MTCTVKACDLVAPGAYWARLRGRTDWFIIQINTPGHRYGSHAMEGFDFARVAKPKPGLPELHRMWQEKGGRHDDVHGFIQFAEEFEL